MTSTSNNNHGNLTVVQNDILSATELSKYRQAKAVDDMTRATQHLTEIERQAVFNLAQNPSMCHVKQPTLNSNNTLPNIGRNPVATNVMQGVVACLSRFSASDKAKYHGLIENMGGRFHDELGADHHISHLIISPEEIHSSAKYEFLKRKIVGDHVSQVEKEWATQVRIVTPEWVVACWTSKSHVEETQYSVVGMETPILSSSNPSKTTIRTATMDIGIGPTSPSSIDNPLDQIVSDFPEQYPNGDRTFHIEKIDSSKKPVVGWARQCSRNVHRCLGCYVCPQFNEGCYYRQRPQVPRRGKQRSNGVPQPNHDHQCWMHPDAELLLEKCDCKWIINDHSDNLWELIHTGIHNHPVPPPVTASHKAKEKLSEIIRHNPQAKPSQLATGIGGGKTNTVPPVSGLDPKFSNAGYVAAHRKKVLKEIKREKNGTDYPYESLDAVFDFTDNMLERSPGILVDGSIGPRQFFTYASQHMRVLLQSSLSGFSTDTVEGFVESIYFKGEINVTISSTWCHVLQTQAPALVSVLFRKSAESYGIHWDHFFPFVGKNATSLDEFYDNYPGNTSDFSEAIKSAYMNSLDEYCSQQFQQVLSDQQKKDLYRYCAVHYKRNVTRVGQVSAVVHPTKRDEFVEIAFALLEIDDFDEFSTTVLDLYDRFPLLTGWFLWYLQDSRASILFPAVRNMSEDSDMDKFNAMKRDTNAQEGIGGFLQSLKNNQRLGLQCVLEAIEMWIGWYQHRYEMEKCGLKTKYTKATPQQKRVGREKKSHYKAPESGADLLRSPDNDNVSDKKRIAAISECSNAPVQLNNDCNMCFANALFQNLYANDAFRDAIMRFEIDLDDLFILGQPVMVLKKFMEYISAMKKGTTDVTPKGLKDILWMVHYDDYLNYQFMDQLDPMELMDYMLTKFKEDSNFVHHHLQTHVCTLGFLTESFRCRSCCEDGESLLTVGPSTPLLREEDKSVMYSTDDKFYVQLSQCRPGLTLDDCLHHRFGNENELEMLPSQEIAQKCSCDNDLSSPVVLSRFTHWKGSEMKMLVLNVANRDLDGKVIPSEQRVRPQLNVDLTPYCMLDDWWEQCIVMQLGVT